MILTVDIGNTNIKVGAWDGNNLAFISRLQTNTATTSDEYAIKLLNIFKLVEFNVSQFDGAIISSVVPQLTESLSIAIRKTIQVREVLEITPGIKTGLNIKIDNPATLGADIVCAGVAAITEYSQPAIILSLGTATAMFAINKDAEYLGGTLAPGITISMEALSSKAAQLPYISLSKPNRLIGTNTIDSMTSGVVYGNACMIDGMIRRMKAELGDDTTVIASGGLAKVIIPYCEENIILDDNIVLKGLRIIYHKNVAS